jgi:hypothetical protein
MYNNAVHYKVAAVHKPTCTRTYFNKHSPLLDIKLKDLVKSRRSPATNSVLTKTLSYINISVINGSNQHCNYQCRQYEN